MDSSGSSDAILRLAPMLATQSADSTSREVSKEGTAVNFYEPRSKKNRRKKTRKGVLADQLTKEDLSKWFHLPAEEASGKLGISLTVLKRICRKHNISRWPFRKVKSLRRLVGAIDHVDLCEAFSELTRGDAQGLGSKRLIDLDQVDPKLPLSQVAKGALLPQLAQQGICDPCLPQLPHDSWTQHVQHGHYLHHHHHHQEWEEQRGSSPRHHTWRQGSDWSQHHHLQQQSAVAPSQPPTYQLQTQSDLQVLAHCYQPAVKHGPRGDLTLQQPNYLHHLQAFQQQQQHGEVEERARRCVEGEPPPGWSENQDLRSIKGNHMVSGLHSQYPFTSRLPVDTSRGHLLDTCSACPSQNSPLLPREGPFGNQPLSPYPCSDSRQADRGRGLVGRGSMEGPGTERAARDTGTLGAQRSSPQQQEVLQPQPLRSLPRRGQRGAPAAQGSDLGPALQLLSDAVEWVESDPGDPHMAPCVTLQVVSPELGSILSQICPHNPQQAQPAPLLGGPGSAFCRLGSSSSGELTSNPPIPVPRPLPVDMGEGGHPPRELCPGVGQPPRTLQRAQQGSAHEPQLADAGSAQAQQAAAEDACMAGPGMERDGAAATSGLEVVDALTGEDVAVPAQVMTATAQPAPASEHTEDLLQTSAGPDLGGRGEDSLRVSGDSSPVGLESLPTIMGMIPQGSCMPISAAVDLCRGQVAPPGQQSGREVLVRALHSDQALGQVACGGDVPTSPAPTPSPAPDFTFDIVPSEGGEVRGDSHSPGAAGSARHGIPAAPLAASGGSTPSTGAAVRGVGWGAPAAAAQPQRAHQGGSPSPATGGQGPLGTPRVGWKRGRGGDAGGRGGTSPPEASPPLRRSLEEHVHAHRAASPTPQGGLHNQLKGPTVQAAEAGLQALVSFLSLWHPQQEHVQGQGQGQPCPKVALPAAPMVGNQLAVRQGPHGEGCHPRLTPYERSDEVVDHNSGERRGSSQGLCCAGGQQEQEQLKSRRLAASFAGGEQRVPAVPQRFAEFCLRRYARRMGFDLHHATLLPAPGSDPSS